MSRREIASLPLPGMHRIWVGHQLGTERPHRVVAIPHLNEGRISVIDMEDWSLVKTIETSGPGFFLRSHDGTPYLWADVFTGDHKGEMRIIDKQSLEVVKGPETRTGKDLGAFPEPPRTGNTR